MISFHFKSHFILIRGQLDQLFSAYSSYIYCHYFFGCLFPVILCFDRCCFYFNSNCAMAIRYCPFQCNSLSLLHYGISYRNNNHHHNGISWQLRIILPLLFRSPSFPIGQLLTHWMMEIVGLGSSIYFQRVPFLGFVPNGTINLSYRKMAIGAVSSQES